MTTHLWTSPLLSRGSKIHDRVFDALRDLDADLVRFLPWFSHPRISVPALKPPTDTETFWDFQLLDPFVADFIDATNGRPVVANFATIPAWMFTTEVTVPDDPDQIVWDYEQGAELRDPTGGEVADYFYRIASWYIAGGFTDEVGRRHESGHRYRFAYWEVLCEPDIRGLSPQAYTRLFDAIVERLRPLDPQMKFVGLSLTHQHRDPEYFWQFLDSPRHRDAISYHFYAHPDMVNPYSPEGNPPFEHWPATFFAQADGFVDQVRYIESIRRRLAPDTKTFVNEVGTFTPDVLNESPDIPDQYWQLSAAVQSYVWAHLVTLGVDLVGIAEFMDYPGMIPGVTLVDWETGEPNARYRALQTLLRHFGPGDTLVATSAGNPHAPHPHVYAQAFVTAAGVRKLLLINKTGNSVDIELSASTEHITLDAYAVAVYPGN
ncbi:hypothetical protein [Mycobacterium sp. SMC-4]|uniref:hypothetical protein n=1 Tax=Mycobacterium sp. SMC-4 TaxID=2857059 RepID=UPI0021B43947|nr:hypothetical protein [Mycobacterium sp. SMC-4]